MKKNNYIEELLEKYPPASQNNSRKIVREAYDRFHKNPSEANAEKFTQLTGETYDFSDSDWGNDPEEFNEYV